MSLLSGVAESLLFVIRKVERESDMSALGLTIRRLYQILESYLRRENILMCNSSALLWVVENLWVAAPRKPPAGKPEVRFWERSKVTALPLVSSRDHHEIASLLLRTGADIEIQDKRSLTPLS